MATAGKYPPLLTLSDFQHFDPNLKTKIVNFENFLMGTHNSSGQVVPNHAGYDGRIQTGTAEATYAESQGYTDVNGDNYIDEYDLFLAQYDKNGDKRISQAEFTNPATGLLYDANLFAAIDQSGGPEFVGDTTRRRIQRRLHRQLRQLRQSLRPGCDGHQRQRLGEQSGIFQ